MLRFAEEIMLLILDDISGEFARVPEWSLRCALAGAVLMDLALENRIDTDPERLFLIDPTPVGDDLLDPVLASIAQSPETYDARYWVQRHCRARQPNSASRARASGRTRHSRASEAAFSVGVPITALPDR